MGFGSQLNKGIPVFLSISGSGKNYSLLSSMSLEAVANHLRNVYLGGGSSDVFCPFGDAVVDGIDFYIDHGAPSKPYDELAHRLDYFNSMCRYPATGVPLLLCLDEIHGWLFVTIP
jgi:chitinase